MKEVKLKSGSTLKITPATFEVSKALYQAILREAKNLHIDAETQMVRLYKDLFCLGFASLDIEACIWACFPRVTYDNGKGDLKIDKDTFEPILAREDYWEICSEVAKENVAPFAKRLYAEYGPILQAMLNGQS